MVSVEWEECWSRFGDLISKTISWFEKRGFTYRRKPWVSGFLVEHSRGVALDLGSGIASTTLYALSKGLLERLILVDLSLPSLEFACKSRDPRVICIQSDVFDEAFVEGVFDTIYLLSILHHIPSSNCRGIIYRNIYRYLKPNGRIVVTVWNPSRTELVKTHRVRWIGDSDLVIEDSFGERYYHIFSENELVEEIVKSGFKIVEKGFFTQTPGREGLTRNIYVVFSKG